MARALPKIVPSGTERWIEWSFLFRVWHGSTFSFGVGHEYITMTVTPYQNESETFMKQRLWEFTARRLCVYNDFRIGEVPIQVE